MSEDEWCMFSVFRSGSVSAVKGMQVTATAKLSPRPVGGAENVGLLRPE